MNVYRVRDWHEHYENNRTRELRNPRYFLCPNSCDNVEYRRLVSQHPNGAAHLGAWRAIQGVASRSNPRGCLLTNGGRPHTPETLEIVTAIPAAVFAEVLPRLLSDDIGWVEIVPLVSTEGGEEHPESIAQEGTKTQKPQEAAASPQGQPHKGAGLVRRQPHESATGTADTCGITAADMNGTDKNGLEGTDKKLPRGGRVENTSPKSETDQPTPKGEPDSRVKVSEAAAPARPDPSIDRGEAFVREFRRVAPLLCPDEPMGVVLEMADCIRRRQLSADWLLARAREFNGMFAELKAKGKPTKCAPIDTFAKVFRAELARVSCPKPIQTPVAARN